VVLKKTIQLILLGIFSGFIAGGLGASIPWLFVAPFMSQHETWTDMLSGAVLISLVGFNYGSICGAILDAPAFLIARALAGPNISLGLLFRSTTVIGFLAAVVVFCISFSWKPNLGKYALFSFLFPSLLMVLNGLRIRHGQLICHNSKQLF
jgi:hypothetical protein